MTLCTTYPSSISSTNLSLEWVFSDEDNIRSLQPQIGGDVCPPLEAEPVVCAESTLPSDTSFAASLVDHNSPVNLPEFNYGLGSTWNSFIISRTRRHSAFHQTVIN